MTNVMQGANVRMREFGNRFGFALQSLLQLRVGRKVCRQHLDRNRSLQASIEGAIHFAHAARAQRRKNFIGTEFGTEGEWHPLAQL